MFKFHIKREITMENKLKELKMYLIRNYHSPKLLLIGLDLDMCEDLKKLFPVTILKIESLEGSIDNEILKNTEIIICSSKYENKVKTLNLGELPVIIY